MVDILFRVFEVPAGIVYGNAIEWAIHKFLLHGLGRDKKSFWSFHWHVHHRKARRDGFVDSDYKHGIWQWDERGKEAASLLLLGVAHAPLLPWLPGFTLAFWASLVRYYVVHKRAHLDPAWARANVPWHVDHHLGPDQDANWCVTAPWFDLLTGTRKPWVGTPEERAEPVERAC